MGAQGILITITAMGFCINTLLYFVDKVKTKNHITALELQIRELTQAVDDMHHKLDDATTLIDMLESQVAKKKSYHYDNVHEINEFIDYNYEIV
jgi:hypothetical protein